MTDDDEPLPRNTRDQIVDVGEVVEEVVIAARPDPIAIAMPSQIRRDDVTVRSKPLGDLVPAVAEIEEAMEEEERRVERRVPLANVVREPRCQGDAALSQGLASM